MSQKKTKKQKSITWIVYHTSKKRRDSHWPTLEEKLNRLNRKYGKIDLKFEPLPLYTKDVSKN